MSKMLVCPKCMSTDTKRIVYEWNLKETIVIFVVIVVYAVTDYVIWGRGSSGFYEYRWIVDILLGIVIAFIFPFLLNLRFPRYKCKSCGKKFKANGEDAEDVFEEHEVKY